MKEQTITCPFCKKEIPLTEAFSHQLKESLRKEVEREFDEFREKLEAEAEKAQLKARETVALEMADLQEQLDEKKGQLKAAQKAELELRKRERQVEQKEKNFDLEMARKVAKLEKGLREILEEEHRLDVKERDKLIDDLKKQLKEAQIKAEVGSQQLQGEVLELDLEAILNDSFSDDDIKRVPKGYRGADLLQSVYSKSRQRCGKIIWETKRTRKWSKGWIKKLKDDQRRAKADIAVLATEALPDQIKRFGIIEGVWVCHYDRDLMIGVAAALRITLLEVAREKSLALGKDEKMESLYRYLTGTEFRQRIKAVVEAFDTMRKDLETEKRVTQKYWAKREKEIERVIGNIVSMYGELEGIGAAVPPIPGLELKALPTESGES